MHVRRIPSGLAAALSKESLDECTMHVQPAGEIIVSAELSDGRTFRVCGGIGVRDCKPSEEMAKMLAFVRQGSRSA